MSIENSIFYENSRKISNQFLCIFTYPLKIQNAVTLKLRGCIVGHEKHGLTYCMRLYQIGSFALVIIVYALEGFVKEQYAEIGAERADDSRSPLHSARKLLYGTGYVLSRKSCGNKGFGNIKGRLSL